MSVCACMMPLHPPRSPHWSCAAVAARLSIQSRGLLRLPWRGICCRAQVVGGAATAARVTAVDYTAIIHLPAAATEGPCSR